LRVWGGRGWVVNVRGMLESIVRLGVEQLR
jgi:hypothetical protein